VIARQAGRIRRAEPEIPAIIVLRSLTVRSEGLVPDRSWLWSALGLAGVAWSLAACAGQRNAAAPAQPKAVDDEALVLFHRDSDVPRSVLEAFTRETGIAVRQVTFQTQNQAVAALQEGGPYDLAVIETDRIPTLAEGGHLAAIDYRNVPNFRNISANFRDLAYDPANEHSVPFSWGTTGLIVRPDLVEDMPTRWADLWNPDYRGRIAVREAPRDLIGATLLSPGYSVNAENSTELAVAQGRLMRLKDSLVVADPDGLSGVRLLNDGAVNIFVGRPEDYLAARDRDLDVVYVLPQEGTILWGSNFVLPMAGHNKETAERFINFVLRPEMSARIANENRRAAPNEPARQFIREDILENRVVNPADPMLRNAAINLPVSPRAQAIHENIWRQFRAADG
jgi:spermidine/putrescine transport system substrate-binding protein